MAAARIADEPAFVLHRYDWSESSLILETFSRHKGRVALAAKGVKKPSSNFRPVLLPLQPLRLGWRAGGDGNAEIHTLSSAEWMGGHVMPRGEALLAGLYCNELLLRLLARDDPHPVLFDVYTQTVQALAQAAPAALGPLLRSFELLLLRELGYLPALDAESANLQPLADDQCYALSAEGGLSLAPDGKPLLHAGALGGVQWRSLERALRERAHFSATLRVLEHGPLAQALKPQLRALLQYHCGSPLLRTRQLMMQLQSL